MQIAEITSQLSSESEAVLTLTNELKSAHGVIEELHEKMKAVPDDILQATVANRYFTNVRCGTPLPLGGYGPLAMCGLVSAFVCCAKQAQ